MLHPDVLRFQVMHAAPFPTAVFRRFDLNKFRSLLIARVKTGIQLDSDQFVAPRVAPRLGIICRPSPCQLQAPSGTQVADVCLAVHVRQ